MPVFEIDYILSICKEISQTMITTSY